jgi:hypothetical protein
MAALLIDHGSETAEADAGRPGLSPERRRQHNRFLGVYFVGTGLVMHWFLPTTTLRCQPPEAAVAACVVSDRILLGLVPTATEEVAGVRGARTETQKGHRSPERNSYHVVLDTAVGEREMTWSKSFEAAYQLEKTIDARLRDGAPFEASLGFAFFDWAFRGVALTMLIWGAAMAVAGFRRAR